MNIEQRLDENQDALYSADVKCHSTKDKVADFKVPMLDVRDGEFLEIGVTNKNSGKEYIDHIPVGTRKEVEDMLKASNREKGSKFIPVRKVLTIT